MSFVWDQPQDGLQMDWALPRKWFGWHGREEPQALALSSSDSSAVGGSDLLPAFEASWVGPQEDSGGSEGTGSFGSSPCGQYDWKYPSSCRVCQSSQEAAAPQALL